MGENGYYILKHRYNWNTIAAKTLGGYEKVIEKRSCYNWIYTIVTIL